MLELVSSKKSSVSKAASKSVGKVNIIKKAEPKKESPLTKMISSGRTFRKIPANIPLEQTADKIKQTEIQRTAAKPDAAKIKETASPKELQTVSSELPAKTEQKPAGSTPAGKTTVSQTNVPAPGGIKETLSQPVGAAPVKRGKQKEKPARPKKILPKTKPKEKETITSKVAGKIKKSSVHGGGGGDGERSTVTALPMLGASEQIVEKFASAKASQIAASYPALGTAVTQKLGNEQTETSDSLPVLKAKTEGANELQKPKAAAPEAKQAKITDGSTEAEPSPPKVEEHKDIAPPPDNKKVDNQMDRGNDNWFFSMFKNMFGQFVSDIKTTDNGVNTSAGERPQMNLTGEANPERSVNQRNESDQEMDSGKSKAVNAIQSNPGKQAIKPLKVNKETKPELKKKDVGELPTPENKNMDDYVNLPIPQDVRDAADKKMAPLLEKDMTAQKEVAKSAAKQRDKDKQAAVSKAEKDNDDLNKNASKEQMDIVSKSKKDVDDIQQSGVKKANDKMAEFKKEADTEQNVNDKEVQDRVTKDQTEANKTIDKGEEDARKEKEKREAEAAKKKAELEKEKENQSWWDRAVNAVKSAVKAITSAIDSIFSALRKAVKFIIDKAKNAALAVIEAGRRWIVDKLNKFRNWLKDKVSKYIGAVFPGLAKKINAAIDSAVDKAIDTVNKVADKLKAGVEALANALEKAIDSILDKFQTALKAAVQIVGALLTGDFTEALKIAFLAACDIAGIDSKPIMDFLNYAGDTIKIIFKHPVRFIVNVAKGIKKGLDQFLANIKKHLLNGLIAWLTGTLSEVGITLPDKFDLKGIFSLVMQILGLTYQAVRAKIVKRLGSNGEEIVSKIETGVEIIKDFIARGPIALWERLKDFLSNLKETVMEGIRDWVIHKVIVEGITWLISLLNPASAIVKAIKMLYDVVMFFVERFNQIVAFVKSVFQSVGALARGALGQAANAVENALARSVPVIISFLASLIGLGGVGKAVRNVIEKVRKPIDKALDKVIGWVVDKGKALFEKGKALFHKGKEAVFGKDKSKEEQDNSTRERNKKLAAQKVHSVLNVGIKKSDLLILFDKLQKDYNLKSISLTPDDDVVIINSDPVRIKGKPYNKRGKVKTEELALQKEDGKLKKASGGNIQLGKFSSAGKIYPTLRGVVKGYLDAKDVAFPISNLPDEAARPDEVKAELTGALDEGVSKNVIRDSALTATVGNLGDIESAIRRDKKTTHSIYQGGHIVASRFGGPEVYKNLIPQARQINLGFYKSMENFITKNLKAVQDSGTSKFPPKKNLSVSMDVSMKYGNIISRPLVPLMETIAYKALGKERAQTSKKKDKTEKDITYKNIRQKEASYLQPIIEEGKADKVVRIAPWIPTQIKANITFESSVAEGFSGRENFFESKNSEDTSAEIIIDEKAKVNKEGVVQSPEKNTTKVGKKNWSATFTFDQSNKL